MRRSKVLNRLQFTIGLLFVFLLAACVEVKSDAKVGADARVQFTTTYDLSKVITALNATNQGSVEELAKGLSCERVNEKLTKDFICKDLGAARFSVTGTFDGEDSNGVVLDKDKKISVDVVKLFRKTTDLSLENSDSDDVASKLTQRGLVPVALDQAAQYKQMGVALALQVSMPHSILSVNGVDMKKLKDRVVTVNFVDIAGKESYIIIGEIGKNNTLWKRILLLFVLLILILAVPYFLKVNKERKRLTHKTD